MAEKGEGKGNIEDCDSEELSIPIFKANSDVLIVQSTSKFSDDCCFLGAATLAGLLRFEGGFTRSK